MRNAYRLRQRLHGMQQKAGEAAERAASLGAQKALQRAQSLVPVRTGRLQASLQKKEQGGSARVFARVHYALYVERGTRRMTARPYLAPAFRRAVQETPFDQIFRETVL